MSRGCGKIQQALFTLVVSAKKPITYAEIVGDLLQASGVNDPNAKPRSDRERAIRRALKGLCDRNLLSTLGSGRPGDPYRYTRNMTCTLCCEVIPLDGEGLKTQKGATICYGCARAIAMTYFELVLPGQVEAERRQRRQRERRGSWRPQA